MDHYLEILYRVGAATKTLVGKSPKTMQIPNAGEKLINNMIGARENLMMVTHLAAVKGRQTGAKMKQMLEKRTGPGPRNLVLFNLHLGINGPRILKILVRHLVHAEIPKMHKLPVIKGAVGTKQLCLGTSTNNEGCGSKGG